MLKTKKRAVRHKTPEWNRITLRVDTENKKQGILEHWDAESNPFPGAGLRQTSKTCENP